MQSRNHQLGDLKSKQNNSNSLECSDELKMSAIRNICWKFYNQGVRQTEPQMGIKNHLQLIQQLHESSGSKNRLETWDEGNNEFWKFIQSRQKSW